MPIDSLYGISFHIQADASLIDTTLTFINPTPTWLGTSGNSFNFRKYFRSAGAVDVAECRNDHNNTLNGSGSIGSFVIVTTDNLSGIAICHINIDQVTAVTKSQHYVTLNAINDSVVIDPGHPAGVLESEVMSPEFGVFPNPANENVNVQTKGIAQEITIMNTLGEVVTSVKPNTSHVTLNTSVLAPGVYVITVHNGNSVSTQKLTITH
jgi:hypothetical protein